MKRKVAIVGAGHVGSHVASALMLGDICEEIVLLDTDAGKAECHAQDLQDAACYAGKNTRVYAGSYQDIGDAQVCVLAYCGAIFEENRLEELEVALDIADEILPQLKASGFAGVLVGITNPCDLVAQYFARKTGLPTVGTGTALDSARFRVRLAQQLAVQPASVEGFCLGEHGDSQVPIFSQVRIGGLSLEQLAQQQPQRVSALDRQQVARQTIEAGWHIVTGKGCTEFGIGSAAAELIGAIFADCGQVMMCSGPYRRSSNHPEIFTSIPRQVGSQGAQAAFLPVLTQEEQAQFDASCALLEQYVQQRLDPRFA